MKYRSHYFKYKVNRLKFYFAFFVLAALMIIYWGWGSYIFQAEEEAMLETATINIDANQLVGDLPKEIFGTGGGGLETDLFRPGMVTAYKNMGTGLIRMHSEGFLKEGFTRAIGPVNERVVLSPNSSESDPENKYPLGPDEWGKTAKLAGSELMTTFTFYDGSQKYLNQYVNLLEYMNISVTPDIEVTAISGNWSMNLVNPDKVTSWGAFDIAPEGYFAWLRKEVGGGVDPGPYNCKYWEIGNEEYGNWYPYTMPSEIYIQKAIEFGNALKAKDSSIKVGAVISGSEQESVWDKASSGTQIWDHVITKGVIENALECNFSESCQPAIDFLIPHFYDPSLRGRDDTNTYELFNPKNLNYILSDGSSAPIQSGPLVYVSSVTIGPGVYTFSIEGQSVKSVNQYTGEYDYAKMKLRLIDDGGAGNISAEKNVTLNLPATVYETGELEIKSDNLQKYNFPGTITLNKPIQKYRLELLYINNVYSPGISQAIASSEVKTILKTTADRLAQSFISNDKNLNSVIFAYGRTDPILPLEANIVVEVYPDSGSDSPDTSGNPLATFGWEDYRNVGSLRSSTYQPITLTRKSLEVDNLIIGNKYWIIQRLDRNLEMGANSVYAYGNAEDSFSKGSLKISTNNGSTWQSDINVMDQYFYAQPEIGYHPNVKNITASLGASNPTIIGLTEKDWFEGLALAANIHSDVSIKQNKTYLNTANQELKSAHPEWANLTDYIPEFMATEYAYLNWNSTANLGLQPQERTLFPAIHDANTLVSLVNNKFKGAVIWATAPRNMVYRYQGGLVSVNGTQGGTTQQDDPNLYLYTPRYYMMKILSENRGNKTVATDVTSPKYSYNYNFGWLMVSDDEGGAGSQCDHNEYYWSCWPGLMKTPVFQRPYLNGYSSYDELKNKLYLSIVNSNADHSIISNIKINGFEPTNTAMIKTLNSQDDKGMKSMNGFVTKLAAEMPLGTNQITVFDASEFKQGDTIAVQSTSHGTSEYFRVASVDYGLKKIHLSDLNGLRASAKYCYMETYVGNCHLVVNTDVVRLTGNVGIANTIASVNKEFTYKFPAHSVTVIEFNKSGTRAEPDSSPSVAQNKTSPISKIKTSPSASITPSSETSVEPVSEQSSENGQEEISKSSPTSSNTPTPPIVSVENQTPTPIQSNEESKIEKTPARGENTLIAGDKNKTIIVIVTIIVVLILGALGLIYRLFYYRPGQADQETKI